MKHFKHLSFTDRLRIESALKVKMPVKQIAELLGVHVSTIYRELKRGIFNKKVGFYDNYRYERKYKTIPTYSPDIAQQLYKQRMQLKGPQLKIGDDYEFAEYLEHKICDEGYSPDTVLGEIKRLGIPFKTSICTNTLYSYIQKGVFGRLSLSHLSSNDKKKRVKKTIKRAPRGTSIEKRPADILLRDTFGHWEMDCVCGCTNAVFLVLTERKTRKEIIMKMNNQKAESVIHCLNVLERKYGKLFSVIFKTITVDNGSEFSAFNDMEKSIYGRGKKKRTTVYYCHPYSSSERGSNERMNREIRRKVPKGTDLSKFSDIDVIKIERWLNNCPRRILNYATADELFYSELSALM